MRLTGVHLLKAVMVVSVGAMAFAAMLMSDYLVGRDSPFLPGIISAIVVALWIFLLRRYGPRRQHPADPRRQRIWVLSSSAAVGALAVSGLIAAMWIQRTYSQPSAPCSCLPFDARVELAKGAEQKEEFKSYQSAIYRQAGDHFAATMQSCFANVRDPITTTFVLVADITAEGAARAIEVRPATNIARCFAAGFAAALFPPPPQYPDHAGFPITIEMRIK